MLSETSDAGFIGSLPTSFLKFAGGALSMSSRTSWEFSSHPSKWYSNSGMTLNSKSKRAIPSMGSFSRCWNCMRKFLKLSQWGWLPSTRGTPWPWNQMCINFSVFINDDGQGIETCKAFLSSSKFITTSSIRSDKPVGCKIPKEHHVSFEMDSFHSPIIWMRETHWSPEGI